MFENFIDVYKPKSLLAICDRSKFNIEFYKNLGFIEVSSPYPVCNWYNSKENNLFKGYAPEKFLINKGYLPIYDCGYSYLEWNK